MSSTLTPKIYSYVEYLSNGLAVYAPLRPRYAYCFTHPVYALGYAPCYAPNVELLTQQEPCLFWLRMADTRSVRPIGLTFTLSVVILRLDAPGAYPLLLGRLWLRTTNIKQHWQCNTISFRRWKTKVRVVMEEHITTPPDTNSCMRKESICSMVS